MKTIYTGLATLVGLYLLYLLALYAAQGWLIYPGTRLSAPVSANLPEASAQLWRIPIEQGQVEAVLLPALPLGKHPQPLLIFAHGNYELIDHWLNRLDGFRQRGFHVLLVEYPGYGRSDGMPSEATITAAMVAAYDWVANDSRIDKQRIWGYGMSLGGAAIAALASQRPLQAVLLQSTFPSLRIFARRYAAPEWLLKDRFDTYNYLRKFSGALMVIHGREDGLIPWSLAEPLATGNRGQFHLYACEHVCWDPQRLPFWTDFDRFRQRIQ